MKGFRDRSWKTSKKPGVVEVTVVSLTFGWQPTRNQSQLGCNSFG